MARETKVVLTDDIDGTDAAETVSFALDQTAYEIELSSENAQKLRDVLAPYTAKARRVAGGGRTVRRSAGGGANSSKVTAKIRTWAKENGYDVSDRGRISYPIVEAYRAAHQN
ncbi:Lsr2 family protein [Brevibacterium sp. BRM-1]|uniref:histone-like nucleoid-structuring protein Lsr2 n=1 Tax=Brevibacterium sp. BRM-1 TaxID=2999062 RepID=UPI002281F60C|nr:Lsr2 family protein [Brevibacterium sp. BRM-1]WAL39092.1 Lsr2 family protein [Brevibacterium sp. BRM-1]